MARGNHGHIHLHRLQHKQSGLQRELGLVSVVLCGTGVIIGAGIFVLIGIVAGIAGQSSWLAFFVASVLAGCTGLSYAELSSKFPDDSAEAHYTRAAFGKHVGFLAGIMAILTGITASAAVSLGFGGYLSSLIGLTTTEAGLIILILLSLIACWGIKETSWFVSILSIAQIVGLLFIAAIGLPSLNISQFTEISWHNWQGIMSGAAIIFFAYLGFEDIVKFSEEAKHPRRTIPLAIIISIIVTTIIYVLVAVSSISILGVSALSSSSAPLADVAGKVFGNYASLIIAVLALAATSCTILILITATSRLIYGMAHKQHDLPKNLGKIQQQLGTPVPAILLTVLLAIPFLLVGNIKLVAEITNFAIFIVFILINLAVIVLRYRMPDKLPKLGFQIPINIGKFPVISLAGMVFCLILLLFLDKAVLIAGGFLLLIGLLVSYWHYLPYRK